ncbi:MAG: hypothetical protein RJA44_609 [Pseudomonadota bacterium]|jgi:thiol:disulfide interchange protein DsbA
MDRRAFIRHSSVAALVGSSAWQTAQAQNFVEGRNYVKLSQTLPVAAPTGKIEVIEFFWYGCPHCNAFEPTLEAWVKKLPADVAFRRVHVGFRPSFEPQQRLQVTLEQMGLMDSVHRKIFYAIHQQGMRLDKPEQIIEYVASQGVDRAQFTSIYNSFGVATKVKQGKQLAEAYKIDGVPALGIHGRYYTSPSLAGGEGTPEAQGQTRALALVDQLVAQIRKGG